MTPISLKQTQFSLKQFAKWMGQPNLCTLHKWKKASVARFLGKKHQTIIRGQIRGNQLRDGALLWETAVAHFLVTFETSLPLENLDNVE
jgi:hypothetical protein